LKVELKITKVAEVKKIVHGDGTTQHQGWW
jgi:hypothetical protein